MTKYTGEELMEIRSRMGLTQTAFADALGVGIRIVQLWEKNKREISATAQLLLQMILKYEQSTDTSLFFNDDIELAKWLQENKNNLSSKEHYRELFKQSELNNKKGDIIKRLNQIEKTLGIKTE